MGSSSSSEDCQLELESCPVTPATRTQYDDIIHTDLLRHSQNTGDSMCSYTVLTACCVAKWSLDMLIILSTLSDHSLVERLVYA